MPLVSKTFDQLLDFTRTSAATFVGSNGLIQNTAASRNLLLWTQQFDNAAWPKTALTATANTVTAPDGTSTADTLIDTVATSNHYAAQTITTTAATTYTMSAYVKNNGRGFVILNLANLSGATNYAAVSFNLSTGAVVNTLANGTGYSVSSSSITSVGDGWYRCTMTAVVGTTTATTASVALSTAGTIGAYGLDSYLGNGSGVYLWGAQLEAASAASTYTRNNGGVFPPRFDYDPVTLAPKGLLIEEQRTNLATYTQQFDNAAWTKLNATVTANATTAPDGTSAADFVVPDTANNQHGVYQTVAAVSGTTYTQSVYAKAGGYNWLYMTDGNSITGQASFNLSNGTLGTVSGTGSPSATITAVGNGWYRCTLTLTPISTAQNIQCRAANANGGASYAGDGTSGIYIYGAQLEAGAFATSYIPTVASQVTRTSDSTSIVAPNFAPWYNATEGTFVFEYSRYQNADAFGVILETKPTSTVTSDRFAAAATSTADPRMQLYPNGSSVLDTTSTFGVLAVNTVVKGALAYRSGDSAATRNGASPSTSATAFATPAYTNLQIGSTDNGTYGPVTTTQLNGHIRSIRYYPTRLTNAQLQALTA